MKRIINLSVIYLIFLNAMLSQNIYLDGSFSDWSAARLQIEDIGDKTGLELTHLSAEEDDDYIYLLIALNTEINLQENNSVAVHMDLDNSLSTGVNSNGIGVDFIYYFGQRMGSLQGQTVFHNDVGFYSLPTVTSDTFEMVFTKAQLYNNIIPGNELKMFISLGNINPDIIPNDVSSYSLDYSNSNPFSTPVYQFRQPADTDLRILSYNVLRDNIFDNQLDEHYERILSMINADIMCFQEVYNFSENALLNKLESLGVINNIDEWYACKDGNDLITISKYPIEYHTEIAGNSAVKLNLPQSDILIFNCHLPCCDDNSGRTQEIDEMLVFLRNSLEGLTDLQLEAFTPYVILGDMNFVGLNEQVNALMTGDIAANFIYGEDVVMDYGLGFLKSVKAVNTSFPGLFTWYNPSSSFPPGRLDYMFYTSSLMDNINSFSLNTLYMNPMLLNELQLESSDAEQSSDHSPLVADFSFSLTANQELDIANNMTVYPNPVRSLVNIESDNLIETVELYDLYGSRIKRTNAIQRNYYQLDISDIPASVYFIIISGENTRFKEVIVKN